MKPTMLKPEDVVKGQSNLIHIKEFIPEFWTKNGYKLQRMWQAFFWNGNSEILMIDDRGFENGDEAKEMEAQVIREYCHNKKPSALAQITEAWAYIPPEDANVNLDTFINNTEAYQAFKKTCKRQEILICTIETKLGAIKYIWDIVRDGETPALANFRESANSHCRSTARFEGFLEPEPQEVN